MGTFLRPAAARFAALLVLSVAGSPVAARGPAIPGTQPDARQALPGTVIVKLRDALPGGTASKAASGLAGVDAALAAHAVTEWTPVLSARRVAPKPTTVHLERVYVVHYADGEAPEAVAAELGRLPGVEYAEPHWVYTLSATPNDTSYPNQSAYLSRMRFPQGWDTTKGEQGSVVVAIVDGGTQWQHPDLQANVWTNPGETPGNGLDDDGNGFVDDVRGWNFANGTGDPTGLPSTPTNGIHGTHTAGIACARTNNATGVAGTSWNAKLMPINASSPTTDNAIAYGYEGILYAGENGADVINCSWGGQGSPSAFEQEVIDHVWQLGAAVIGAAGNNNSGAPHYPSAYRHVLSVANVSNFDVRNTTSNHGPTIDVSAPGVNITSTIPGSYGLLTGTSMSSPQVAGLCALVKTRWPGYTADQVMERVRVTSDNIDAINPVYAGMLGYGRVNAENALRKNTPALRITQMQFTETDGDGIIEPGETVQLTPVVTNFLADCIGITIKLRETSTWATVVDSVVSLGGLDSLTSATLPPLSLLVSPGAPIQTLVDCMLAVTTASPAYTDRDRFQLTVLPTFVNHDIGNVKTSVTSVGKLGFSVVAGGSGADGIGFAYKTSPNLLYEGALMIGTGVSTVSDAARGASPTVSEDDFGTVRGGVPAKLQPGPWAAQQTVATFNDSLAASPLPVRVRQDTYAYADAVHDDYVILRYTIRNTGGDGALGFARRLVLRLGHRWRHLRYQHDRLRRGPRPGLCVRHRRGPDDLRRHAGAERQPGPPPAAASPTTRPWPPIGASTTASATPRSGTAWPAVWCTRWPVPPTSRRPSLPVPSRWPRATRWRWASPSWAATTWPTCRRTPTPRPSSGSTCTVACRWSCSISSPRRRALTFCSGGARPRRATSWHFGSTAASPARPSCRSCPMSCRAATTPTASATRPLLQGSTSTG